MDFFTNVKYNVKKKKIVVVARAIKLLVTSKPKRREVISYIIYIILFSNPKYKSTCFFYFWELVAPWLKNYINRQHDDVYISLYHGTYFYVGIIYTLLFKAICSYRNY